MQRIILLLTMLFALGCQAASAQAMQIFYWPGMEPAGHTKTLMIKPFMPRADKSYPSLEELPAWMAANWKKEDKQCIIVAAGSWKSQQAHNCLKDDDGNVTVESIAYHVRKKMVGWDRAINWWAAYLTVIERAGYDVALVAMDIEGLQMSTGWKYDPDQPGGDDIITMKQVIRYLYEHKTYVKRLPSLDLESVVNPGNLWGDRGNEQQMLIWNHYTATLNANRLTKVFADTAERTFPDVIVNNYDACQTKYCPRITFKHGHPRSRVAVGGNSAPVLYLHDGYGIKTNQDAMSSLDPCLPPKGKKNTVVAWIGGAYREGAKHWGMKADDPNRNVDNLIELLRDKGCPFLMIFLVLGWRAKRGRSWP